MFRTPNRQRLGREGLPRFLLIGLAIALIWLGFNRVSVEAARPYRWPAQIITVTPMADGSIVHIVQEGENLASIAEAYNVSMSDIRGMNGMAPSSNLIFPGQRLIIRLPLPPTETPTITPTIPKPTRTPTIVTPTRTPRPTRTPSPTMPPTPTPNPMVSTFTNFINQNQRPFLIFMIALCAVGLAWTLWAGFRPSRQAK
jgi:hypothetical protein